FSRNYLPAKIRRPCVWFGSGREIYVGLLLGEFKEIRSQKAQFSGELIGDEEFQERTVGRRVIALGVSHQKRLPHHVKMPMVEVFLLSYRIAEQAGQTVRKLTVVQVHGVSGQHLPSDFTEEVELVRERGEGPAAFDIALHLAGNGIEIDAGQVDTLTRLDIGEGLQNVARHNRTPCK